MATYRASRETELYISEVGYVCIKQTDDFMEEDVLILLSPDQAEWLAKRLPKLAAEANEIFNGKDDEYAIEA